MAALQDDAIFDDQNNIEFNLSTKKTSLLPV